MIRIEQMAPLDINVLDINGLPVSLRSLFGSYTVLYAYPMDETSGCIKEACSIRDVYGEFKNLGVNVIGVSPDNEESHKKFLAHYELQFPLWADTNHELLNALGVWTHEGVARTTFLIDKEGIVVHVWENVNPEGHGEDVLDFVTNLLKK